MARTIVLTFKDNDAAEAFIRAATEVQDDGEDGIEFGTVWTRCINDLGVLIASGAKLDAVYARPTAYCKCPKTGGRFWQKEWRKTEKFGWFVCPNCDRPSLQFVRQWTSNHQAGANNLLKTYLNKIFAPPPEPIEPTPETNTTE